MGWLMNEEDVIMDEYFAFSQNKEYYIKSVIGLKDSKDAYLIIERNYSRETSSAFEVQKLLMLISRGRYYTGTLQE